MMAGQGRKNPFLDARTMSADEVRAAKLRIEALFAQGLTRAEVCAETGISLTSLVHWRKQDQMFNHHLIRAGLRVSAGAGRRL